MKNLPRVVVLCALHWMGCELFAQTAVEDPVEQLLEELASSEDAGSRADALLQIGRLYMYRPMELTEDLDSALIFLQDAYLLSEQISDERRMKDCLLSLSYCYYERKEITEGRATVDALMKIYQRDGNQLEDAEAWRTLGKYILRHVLTFDDIIYCFEQAKNVYAQIGDQKGVVDMHKEIADVHLNQGKFEQSEQELLDVIEMYKAIGFKNLHYTYDLLTAVSTNRGNLHRGLMYGMEAIKSMEATGDSASAAMFFYRLANNHWQLGNIGEAIDWYLKALDENPDISHAIHPIVVEGMIRQGDTLQAIRFLQEAIAESPPNTELEKACIARAYGLYYEAIGKYDKAEEAFMEMVSYKDKYNNPSHYSATVYITVAKFNFNRRNYGKARTYLQKILDLPPGLVNVPGQMDVHKLLYKIDSIQGEYQMALQHFGRYKALNDSIFNATKSMQIEELQVQYETEGQKKDILLLQNTTQLQESKLAQARLTKNLTFGGAAVLLVFFAQLFGRYRVKQRVNRQLELQQMEINQTNRTLQNLLEEKEWLVREIHHRVKNNLQIVMSLLNTQSSFLEDKTALNAIQQSQHRIQAISLIHQKLYQSNNVALIDMGSYVHELVEFLRDTYDIQDKIQFKIHVDPLMINVTQAVPLGLILNEAISNSMKYAFPVDRDGEIRIDLNHAGVDQYVLTIADNGVGLPSDFQVSTSKSLGLSLMKGLSKQLGGVLHVENDQGVIIKFAFKIEQTKRVGAETDEVPQSA